MNETETRELAPPPVLRRGAHGAEVRRVQTWLTLRGFDVEPDGDFGPATEAAVRAFQTSDPGRPWPLTGRGRVDEETWKLLTSPLYDAIHAGQIASGMSSLQERILFIARRHLDAQPREVGGPNRGPWVRLYMDGNEGSDWPWCCGFVTYVLGQALGTASLVHRWRTFSCDELAMRGMGRQQGSDFIAGRRGGGARGDFARVGPGDIFLIRRGGQYWVHTGIVTKVEGEAFHTIEGNTNKEGSREGTEARARVRAFSAATDFILLGGGAHG